MPCLRSAVVSTWLGRGGLQACSWRGGGVFSWVWQGGELWLGVCWGWGQQGPFSMLLQPAGRAVGLPQPGCLPCAASLLYSACQGGKENACLGGFFTISFLPDLLPPSCEGSPRSSWRESKRRGQMRGREAQVPAELKPSFLSWLRRGLVLG